MARIRTIKPEIWTDAEFVARSPLARLMFIGCLNHADDYGVIKDDPATLRLQILPGDDCDPVALVAELVEANFLLRKVAPDGTSVLVIRTFCVHQKIDKRAAGRWGRPDEFRDHQSPPTPDPPRPSANGSTQSPPIPTTPAGSPPRKGTERKGSENHSVEPISPPDLRLVPEPASPPATVPEQVRTVFAVWQETTGHKRAVLDPKRERFIRKALKLFSLDDVTDAVRGWQHSPFHRGKNDRRTVYDGVHVILRDAEQIEMFRDLHRDPKRRPTAARATGTESAERFPTASY